MSRFKDRYGIKVDLPIFTVSISPEPINSYKVERPIPVNFTAVAILTLIGSRLSS